MRTPEEVSIEEQCMVWQASSQEDAERELAKFIRARDREVRLALLNRLYEMYDGVPETGWALDHLRAEIEADNV